MNKKEVMNKLRKYKELKADIVNIEINLKELDEEILGASSMAYGEKSCKTNEITSSTEKQAEKYMKKKETLEQTKRRIELEVAKIDNAITILDDEEREIVVQVLINKRKYYVLQEVLNKSYPRIKQLEENALKKISRYI